MCPFYLTIHGGKNAMEVQGGCALAPTLANVLGHLGKKISTYEARGPTFYTRYFNDIFMTFSSDSIFTMSLFKDQLANILPAN